MRFVLLLVVITATPLLPQTAEWDAFYAKQAEARKRGDEALRRARERHTVDLCSNSSNGYVGIADCLAALSKSNEADYLAYIRSIGALQRLAVPGSPRAAAGAHVERIPFDGAEATWQSYRELACAAMSTQWKDSQVGLAKETCRLDLTWNHMDELAKLYGDLWH